MHLPYVYHGDESEEALAASARTQNAFSAEDAQALAGNRRRTSFEKAVSGMSSVELDAQLADVYAREFGMGKNDIAEDQRRKWSVEIFLFAHILHPFCSSIPLSELLFSNNV